MTAGSPPAASDSGPGVDETNAIRFASGDQVILLPASGRGWLVHSSPASHFASLPSGFETISPDLPSSLPDQASHLPSADQTASEDGSFPPPRRTVSPFARLRT